ncbi:MAG: hypothetical protein HKN33_03270 [Pyrinomonadaceae bacterium]|nr:hypothetical protein [Pyrinomonadaceae bacterium]
MRKIFKVFLSFVMLSFLTAACGSERSFDEMSVDESGTKPSERVLEFTSRLAKGDFVGSNRSYSNRILGRKLKEAKIDDDCEEGEDCLTLRARIDGFEVGIAGGKSEVVEVLPTKDPARVRVVSRPPIPLSGTIMYELVVEEGLWRIDTIYWANGTIVRGFEPDEKSTDAKKSKSGEAQ